MTISENDLILHYSESEKKLVVYRLIQDVSSIDQKVLLTEYPLSKFQSLDMEEAGRLLGENILIFLSGTRKALLEDNE